MNIVFKLFQTNINMHVMMRFITSLTTVISLYCMSVKNEEWENPLRRTKPKQIGSAINNSHSKEIRRKLMIVSLLKAFAICSGRVLRNLSSFNYL